MSIIAMSVYITGCEKETEHVFHDSVLENRYDSTASTSNTLLDNVNFDQDGNILVGNDTNQIVLKHASIEYQKKLSNYYNELGDFDYWNKFYDNYGTPKWDISIIINSTDSTKYNIIVPVLKNNNLSAIIVYSTDGEKEIGNIYSKEFISEVANIENPDMNIIRSYLFPIGLYQLYEYIISGRKNDKLLNWVNSTLSNTSNTRSNDINYRAWCIELEIMDYYTVVLNGEGEIVHISDVPTYTKYIYTYVPCEGPPTFDGGDHTLPDDSTYHPPHHGGGDSTGGDDGEDIWDCAFALEGFMANWKIKQMIAENSLTDPCHPEKTTRQIIAKAIYDKCYKNGVDNLGTVKDFLKDLGDSGDEVVNNLEDQRLRCIWKKLSENANDKIFCNSISNFFGETNVDMVLNEGNLGSALALTQGYNNPNNGFYGWVSISFDKSHIDDYCEITLYQTFLHEGIHAEMYRQNNPQNENSAKAAIWDEWDESIDDHNNIANNYIPYMIETLKQRYGDRYTDLEYEAIAWSGLGNIRNDSNWNENDNTKAWKSLTEEKRKALQDAFKNVNSNCNEDECK